MIRDGDFHLSNIGIDSFGLREALVDGGGNVDHVVGMILGEHTLPMANLLSGDFDVDKMDYFRRDAFFTGTTGGGVDMEVMQRWVRIAATPSGQEACYDPRLVGHLLHLLLSREHVYSVTAYHPVVRIASGLLLVAGDLALRALPSDVAADIFCNLELFDDRDFLSVLDAAGADAPDADEVVLLRRTLQRLYLRRLPKRLRTLPRRAFRETFSGCIDAVEAFYGGEAPNLVYCHISKIADGRYQRLLGSGADPEDDLAILEMSPTHGSMAKEMDCSSEENTLKGIRLLDRHESVPVSLWDWLDSNAGDGAGVAHARALRAFKLSVWKALVLVPASLRLRLQESRQEDRFLADLARALEDDSIRRPLGRPRESWLGAQKMIGDRLKTWRDKSPGGTHR
jgi:hypothetical protein